MPEIQRHFDTVIIGGGFFGMYIAEFMARHGKSILLCEKNTDYMQRASYVNQARVHNGYHYPRSMLTALRSRVSFPRFCQEFPDCIDSSFEKYYMIGKLLGKVTSRQFETFCDRIGAICEPAPHRITRLTNPSLIEAVFATEEFAFDSIKLKIIMQERLETAGVESRLNTIVQRVRRNTDRLELDLTQCSNLDDCETIHANQVFNCTYSMINSILDQSGLTIIPLKHEMAEICLVEVPDELKDKGITVMCGPFFSVMPFPARGLHSFSHVRYTPHYEWRDEAGQSYINAHQHMNEACIKSSWRAMQLDAQRYIPVLSECKLQESLREVKTILPRSEADDSRPILFKANYGLEGFHCLMGGKIDNVYDVIAEIEKLGLTR